MPAHIALPAGLILRILKDGQACKELALHRSIARVLVVKLQEAAQGIEGQGLAEAPGTGEEQGT